MATPTPTTIDIALMNCTDHPATLFSSSYDSAPLTVEPATDLEGISFTQNITEDKQNGTLVYNFENTIKWIIVWTSDNKVCTKIIKVDVPIIWKDMLDLLATTETIDLSDELKLTTSTSSAKFVLDDDYEYVSTATYTSRSDGQRFLLASVMIQDIDKPFIMPTPTTINISIKNDTNFPATLVSSSYEGAPLTIKASRVLHKTFTQDIISDKLLGTLVYDLGNTIKWIILWTIDDNMVSTEIIKFDAPIVWKDILDKLALPKENEYGVVRSEAEAKFELDDDHKYGSKASIFSTSDGVRVLSADIDFEGMDKRPILSGDSELKKVGNQNLKRFIRPVATVAGWGLT